MKFWFPGFLIPRDTLDSSTETIIYIDLVIQQYCTVLYSAATCLGVQNYLIQRLIEKFIQCPARASARDVNVYKSLSLKELPSNSDFIIAISLQPNVKIFQTMKFVWSIHLILKYQRFTPSGLRSIIYKLYFEKIAHWYQMNFKDFLYTCIFSSIMLIQPVSPL